MQIKFENTLEDYIIYYNYLYKTNDKLRKQDFRYRYIYIMLVLSVVWIINGGSSNPHNSISNYIDAVILVIVWIIIFPYGRTWNNKRIAKKYIGENNEILKKELEIKEDSIILSYSNSSTEFNKSEIEYSIEYKVYIYLKIKNDSVIIIPKSIFKSSDEVSKFIKNIKN